MTLTFGLVLAVNLIMESREGKAALEDFQQDQMRLAEAAASIVQSRLDASPEATVHVVLRDLGAIEHQGGCRVFVRAPGQGWMGRSGALPAGSALDRVGLVNLGSVLIPRQEAVVLGLPPRMAALGYGGAETPRGDPWRVAVAGTAYRERDRSQQARWRLLASFISTGGFLFLLIRWALRFQKQEMELAREIELRELTQQKDQELNQANRAATVITLASGVAHEISTPLGVISGRAGQLVTRLKEDERNLRLVQSIQEEVDHINHTIRRFLDLARGGTVTTEDLDLPDLLDSALALVKHRFEIAGVSLATDFGPNLPKIRGDIRLLEHVLVNVLLNACDASSSGDTVLLRASRAEDGLVLEVIDQGKGIPDELAERVMDPFFTTKPRDKGTGLGLAIAQEIVQIHRGRIAFEKGHPKGTRVRIWLPTT
ncbi:MAG TPA: HAMP domain-containing sensor histidine kinase [Geothrix sp.]|nr:HAMP domain-containing sensor histidine kinase [Geothrix sp.]